MPGGIIGWSALGVVLLVLVAVFQSRPGVREKLGFMGLFITGAAGFGFAVYAAWPPLDQTGLALCLLVAGLCFGTIYVVAVFRAPR